MNKVLSVLKKPETYLIALVAIIAAGAYSALRKPFASISKKLPGSDSL